MSASTNRIAGGRAPLQASPLYRFFRAGDEEILALQGVSLTVATGEIVVLAGPSGSGKSTLLACLAGIENPDGGMVRVNGQRLSHQPAPVQSRIRAEHIGLLFQAANLLPHLTVAQNVRLAQALVGRPAQPVAAILERLGIGHRARGYPGELSGGELARAGLAVALANAPVVILADEPTGELDSVTEGVVLDLLVDCARAGAAILVASHSDTVAQGADRIIRMSDGRLSE